jgi:hypothetical protein
VEQTFGAGTSQPPGACAMFEQQVAAILPRIARYRIVWISAAFRDAPRSVHPALYHLVPPSWVANRVAKPGADPGLCGGSVRGVRLPDAAGAAGDPLAARGRLMELTLPEDDDLLRPPLPHLDQQGDEDVAVIGRSRMEIARCDLIDIPVCRVVSIPALNYTRVNDQVTNCWNLAAKRLEVILVDYLAATVLLNEEIDQGLRLSHVSKPFLARAIVRHRGCERLDQDSGVQLVEIAVSVLPIAH